ncbi:MAG: hypothetical protein J6W75_06285 [Bacteroidaceae bacterium]|nr:hypothetical protein [Bacteroidaceae bacterium]
MNVKQSYFDFLAKQGAKQKVTEIIRKGIEEWKQKPAYELNFGRTGVCQIYDNGRALTIRDVCKTDMEVLRAFSGINSSIYNPPGYGGHYTMVAEEIGQEINKCLRKLCGEWILKYRDELLKVFGDRVSEYTLANDDNRKYYIWACVIEYDKHINASWMKHEFPEYIYEDVIPIGPEVLFRIDD